MAVVGPDGVGKTSFAVALLDGLAPRGRYFHFRPPGRGPLASSVPDTDPLAKNRGRVSPPAGWARLLVAIGRFWWGYLRTVRPELNAGNVVVADRWAFGYLVQPTPLRFAGPEWLARLALAVLPKPDFVFNLVAPPEVVVQRKAELTLSEVEAELSAWRSVPGRLVELDTQEPAAALANRAIALLER